jgi:hypothetical protein
MPRDTSPYIVSDYWLDTRRDGKAPGIWQIASTRGRTVVYRALASETSNRPRRSSTHTSQN